jgi:preprotein translocase subunit SecD
VRNQEIAVTIAVVGALALSGCGGSGDGDGDQGDGKAPAGDGKASADEGSFAIYDWEPNVVAPPSVPDPTNTAVSKAVAERVAVKKKGTIVLREPEPLDIPQTKFDESKGLTRKYYVLRDRPAVEQSDVENAYVQVDRITHQPSIIVQLTPEGQQDYEDLTFKGARRGESLPREPLAVSIGPRHAIVVGGEILSIPQLGPGTYTHGIRATRGITVVGGFDKERARELADSIDPG